MDRSIDLPGVECPQCPWPYWRQRSLREHLQRAHQVPLEEARETAKRRFADTFK